MYSQRLINDTRYLTWSIESYSTIRMWLRRTVKGGTKRTHCKPCNNGRHRFVRKGKGKGLRVKVSIKFWRCHVSVMYHSAIKTIIPPQLTNRGITSFLFLKILKIFGLYRLLNSCLALIHIYWIHCCLISVFHVVAVCSSGLHLYAECCTIEGSHAWSGRFYGGMISCKRLIPMC